MHNNIDMQVLQETKPYTILNSQFTIVTDPETRRLLAKCNYCNATLKYHHSTSSLSYHLRSKHSSSVAPKAGAGTGDVKSTDLLIKDVFCVNNANNSGEMNSAEGDEKLAQLIARWITKDARPLNIIEDEGFNAIMNYKSKKVIPTPSLSAVRSCIESAFYSTASEMRDKVRLALNYALSVDHIRGVDKNNIRFISIRVHYISTDWKLASMLLKIHTNNDDMKYGTDTEEQLIVLLNDWEFLDQEKTICNIVTNNINSVGSSYYKQSKCFAYTLQEAIDVGFGPMEIDTDLANAITYYYNSGFLTHDEATTQHLNAIPAVSIVNCKVYYYAILHSLL